MPSRLTAAPNFEDFSLNFATSTWLHQSRWTEREHEWYRQQRMPAFLQIDRGPSISHPRRKSVETNKTTWLLIESDSKSPVAWADLHIFSGQYFTKGYIYTAALDEKNGNFEPLARLLALIFLIGKVDQAHLIPRAINSLACRRLGELIGSQEKLYSLPLQPWREAAAILVAIRSLTITRQEWQTSEAVKPFAHQLKHIELRLKRLEIAQEKMKGKRRKRGLIARIFRPRIEDSLF